MTKVALFTGHRVDAADRPKPRFPPERVSQATQAIVAALPEGVEIGVSSASNGGDILFLEACVARGIPSHIILPFPPEEFLRRSVASTAPGDWEARFHRLWERTPPAQRHVPPATKGNPYAACNDALIDLAAALGEPMLITLWDGASGDGEGGTADLVVKAKTRGWPVTVIAP